MALTLFVLAIIFISSFGTTHSDAGLRGPPHVTSEMPSSYKAKIGEMVRLDCPIDSGPTLQVYYEWKKDGETITSAWDRFRLTPKKLRIKAILPEDGGIYQCKGTNGFGSKQLSTRLIVQDENGEVVGGFEQEEKEDRRGEPGGNGRNLYPDEILGIRRPSFTEISAPPIGSTFRPKVGSTLTLKCHVDGHPKPTVEWIRVKDNIQMPKAKAEDLDLLALDFEDSGVYVCIASNRYGQINASFIVEVIESGMEGPSIISLDSSNVTATKGQLIHFRCLISSDTLPNVQWLRQLGDEEIDASGGLQMAGVRYKVLGGRSIVSAFHNGTYVSEMSLPMEDRATGIVCLATNSGGFKYETTTVTYVQNSESRDSEGVFPVAMLIAIPATLLLLSSALAVTFCCFCKSQTRSSRGLGTVTTATTYATPRDATSNDYQSPTATVPFYNLRQHSFPTQQQQYSPHCGGGGGRGSNGGTNTHFGSQQYFVGSSRPDSGGSPVKFPPITAGSGTHHHHHHHHHSASSPAYASVPICDLPVSSTGGNRGGGPPALPSRTFPNQNLRGGDRSSYNTQGLMTQPLLTQTGSSSDSRESRHSGGGGIGNRTGGDFGSNLTSGQRQSVDHWCMSSEGSEGSWDRKTSRNHHHQIRV